MKFRGSDDSDRVIREMNGSVFQGHQIKVKESVHRKRNNDMGGGQGQGHGGRREDRRGGGGSGGRYG